MTRPCFLVIDREHAGSISTRKLVIETAKLNVITAYTGAEAIEMLERFPKVDGIVMDAGMPDMPCAELLHAMKGMEPKIPLVLISPVFLPACTGADHVLETFDPAKLLDLLRSLVPRAERVQEQELQLAKAEQV